MKYAFWPGCVSKGACPELYDSMTKTSAKLGIELDEMRLLPASVGFWNVPRLLGELPGAWKMLRAGKLPWSHALPWHKPISGIRHVRRLFESARSEKKEDSQ